MSLAVIKDNHITFMGTRYFTGNGQLTHIGDYGEKATPIFGQNKLEVKAHIPAPKLDGKIKTVPPISIDTTQSSKSNFMTMVSGSLKAIGFSGSESAIYDELAKNHLKLVQLYVEAEAMKKAVNDSPQVLDNLRRYGADARIVHQYFVVVEAELAKSFTGGLNFDVSADALGGIVSIKASGGTTVSGKDTITLSSGTGLAYLLLKPIWNKDKTKLDDTDADEWSFG
jgi:hypothetical protein